MLAKQEYFLPAKTKSFKLDRTIGTETFYFTASRHPDLVLENFYDAIERTRKNNQPDLSTALQAEFTQTLNLEPKGPFLDEIVDDVSPMQVKNFCTGCVNIMSFEHQ